MQLQRKIQTETMRNPRKQPDTYAEGENK
jgi:hypothetical protein